MEAEVYIESFDRCPACGAPMVLQVDKHQTICDRGHVLTTERPIRLLQDERVS